MSSKKLLLFFIFAVIATVFACIFINKYHKKKEKTATRRDHKESEHHSTVQTEQQKKAEEEATKKESIVEFRENGIMVAEKVIDGASVGVGATTDDVDKNNQNQESNNNHNKNSRVESMLLNSIKLVKNIATIVPRQAIESFHRLTALQHLDPSELPDHHPQIRIDDKIRATQLKKEHIEKCGNLDHLPSFNPDLYNDPRYKKYNNCYMFAMSLVNTKIQGKPQPGYNANLPHLKKTEISCENVTKYAMADNPNIIQLENNSDSCPCNFYKVSLMVNDKDEDLDKRDYHWVKQLKSFWFAGKAGNLKVSLLDASGNYVTDVEKADWDFSRYGGINYCTVCPKSLCVPYSADEFSIEQESIINSDNDDGGDKRNQTKQVFLDQQHPLREDWETELPTEYI